MPYADTFLIHDQDIELRGDVPRAAMMRVASGPDWQARDNFLSALRHEAETAGAFIAVATSVVNFAARYPHRSRVLLTTLPTWLPPQPQLMAAPADILVRLEVATDIINRLHDLQIHVGIASSLTRSHCASVSAGEAVSPTAIDDLIPLWSAVAERALGLIQELGGHGSADPVQAEQVSPERLLVAAALGGWPCVSAAGRIEIPGWYERRRDRRQKIRLPAIFHVDGRTAYSIETVDLSTLGAGLKGLPELDVGEPAALSIDGIGRAAGRLVWRTGDRGGFRFDVPFVPMLRTASAGYP